MRRYSCVKTSSMGRSGGKEPYQERRFSREAPYSRALTGRKVLGVGEDGSGHCGICSACISVCGVLDCCSHEFCFECIEHWSSVSNQCPLCKLKFRLISVESVHEDIVKNQSSFSVKQDREEEPWDNEAVFPFSFPSFFIDDDAVACLKGSKCLVQAGVPLPDEDAADTSVACDSCDRWYHAGCVGFDPSISWGSWLCPRCSGKAAANKSEQLTASFPLILPPPTTVVSASTSGRVPVAELASNARLLSEDDPSISIFIMDDKESASTLTTCRAVESTVLCARNGEIRQASTSTDDNCPGSRGQALMVVKDEDDAYLPSKDKASEIRTPGVSGSEKLDIEGQKPVDAPSTPPILKHMSNDPTRADFDLLETVPKRAVSSLTSPVASAKAELCGFAKMPLQGLHVLRFEEAGFDLGSESKIEVEFAESTALPVSYFDKSDFEEQPINGNRKQTTKQDRDFVRAEDLPEPPRKIAPSVVKKKELVLGCTSRPSAEKPRVLTPMIDYKDSVMKERLPVIKKEVDSNIPCTRKAPLENLVHMVKDEPSVEPGLVKDELTGGIRSNSSGGVRTRVVVRRDTDGRAAQIVEDIRQQMRSAAGYGATHDHGKVAISDDNFFSAYKAAMVRSNKNIHSVRVSREKREGLKRRRTSWLDKMLGKTPHGKVGGVRENLTKKLYGGGVSRKTWDRDWDISFWKEQSARIKKAKQEASDVVEGRANVRAGDFPRDGILIKTEEAAVEKLKSIEDDEDSIFSRLYVADTSLFPRHNDIKPLYLLGDIKQDGNMKCLGRGKGENINRTATPSREGLEAPSRDVSEKTNKDIVKGLGLPFTYHHVEASGTVKAASIPNPDEKKDKRLWARELLARKSGDAIASSSAKGHAENKKELSLLGQVPEELKPTLPPDRRSRVPTAVRQSQLNRILEHYLRKAKLTSLPEGYKLKSVISSAVAKELEIYDSSNSKGVYMNMCVRALALQDETTVQLTVPQPAESDQAAAVMEAMLATGLISDSPLGSPCENHNTSTGIGSAILCNQSLAFLSNKMKVVLTTSQTVSSIQAPGNNKQSSEESTTGRESDVGTTAKADLAPADDESWSFISAQRNPYQADNKVINQTELVINGQKTIETSTVAKAGKECSAVLSKGAQTSKRAESESTIAGAPVRSMAESDVDDWMNIGKFLDLESRIDKMRKDILKRSSSFPSQFNEDHIFGGSLCEPSSVDKARLEIGKVIKFSSDDGIPGREDNRSNSGGEESAAPPSVQKQVEAYVKEHLKPLYKSGIIKSGQFRFAVLKTASKVMQYHGDATSADFLIVEGSKVKKLADQYLQSYAQKKSCKLFFDDFHD